MHLWHCPFYQRHAKHLSNSIPAVWDKCLRSNRKIIAKIQNILNDVWICADGKPLLLLCVFMHLCFFMNIKMPCTHTGTYTHAHFLTWPKSLKAALQRASIILLEHIVLLTKYFFRTFQSRKHLRKDFSGLHVLVKLPS